MIFSRFVRYEVGDGLKIHYGYDIWCGDQTLMEAFLVLCGNAYFKEASMVDHMVVVNNICQWNIHALLG